jgi:putative hydrolase of the HAD superfamily
MRAVIFDYGMVLCERDPESYSRLLALTGVDHDTFERLYWRDRHQYDLGRVEAPDWWANFARDAGRSFTPSEVATLIECDVLLWTRLNQPMVAWAAALQAAGLRTAILSNMGPDLLRFMRRSPGYAWLSGFTHLTWSCELHIAKPDPAIYLHTCKSLSVAPSEALFIDDKPENIAAAEALGLHGLLFTDIAQLRRDLAAHRWLEDYPQPELPSAPSEGTDQLTAAL